jgi:acyl-[acyl-carrier-protein] desaturase
MGQNSAIEDSFYRLYREYFWHAEANRRWNIEQDIPWESCQGQASDRTATIVQAFAAVETYLPDYSSKISRMVRESRGRAWFEANWVYEESKHSLALEEWLVRSGKRTAGDVQDYAVSLLAREWDLPFESSRQIVIYRVFQELATQLNYRRLRRLARDEGDQALAAVLSYISRDEAAHYGFFKDSVSLFLETDRDGCLRDIEYVLRAFRMPAISIIPGWEDYLRLIVEAGLFSARLYVGGVVRPVLGSLGLTRSELRNVAGSVQIRPPARMPSLSFLGRPAALAGSGPQASPL